MKIAILDDYQNVALGMANWTSIERRAEITVFNDYLAESEELVRRLEPFEIICVMRERTPIRRDLIARLPHLKLIASTAPGNAAIDMAAAEERGIKVVGTGYRSTPTIEMTWALILASVRHLVSESNSVRDGGWQVGIGEELEGKTLGILGLGRVGGPVARIGAAFGMNIIAWSQNLTAQAAGAVGAKLVSKEELFEKSDLLTIHLVLSDRTRGLVGAGELSLMKPTARLINTSRGPIVDEGALIDALKKRKIRGAVLDVFDREPLPKDHAFRHLDNVLATPHVGYVAQDLYRIFYEDTVRNISDWMDARGKH
jgi:phosphoglycerate dehydrogenase-like enzyme